MSATQLLEEANQVVGNATTMQEYIRWGVIENRIKQDCYPHRFLTDTDANHYRIPIPSFGRYALAEMPDETGHRTVTVNKYLGLMPHISAWTWRAADNIKKFIQLLPSPLHGYVPGQAGILHPAIPGDEPRARDTAPEAGWHP